MSAFARGRPVHPAEPDRRVRGGGYRSHDPATRAQTEAARPERSVWVSANAGSGKTRVLTNRVARLLLAGAAPHRILCLTYTKAAAAEMQNRLFGALGAWAMADDAALAAALDRLLAEDEPPLGPDDREAARRLFAQALETPGGLKIQTIHAFCESLLSRFPLEAGVSPHFQVIDEEAAADLLQAAQDRVALTQAEDPILGAAFARLLSDAGETTVEDLFVEALGLRAAFARGGADIRAALATALGALGSEDADGVRARWRAGVDWDRVARLAAAFEASAAKADAARAAALRRALAATSDADALAGVCAAVLAKSTMAPPQKGFPAKAFQTDHPWADTTIHALQQAAMDAYRGAALAERLDASDALAQVARALLAEYAALKAARAGLDYDDLIERAVRLLTRAEARDWVRFKLDGGVEHILVDEAQDTSPAQWRVIGALAEEFFSGAGARDPSETPRTLFAVGDEKQSIYSFQGAAPALLAETGAAFEARAAAVAAGFRRTDMATSFRSAPAILSFVDQVFAPEAARKGLLFGGRAAVAHAAHRSDHPGIVELWPLATPRAQQAAPDWDQPIDAPPTDDPQRRLAATVAETIAGWIGREPLPARGRAIRAGDVLVLVRKRGALSVGIIKRLKQLGVPVSGEDRLLLAGQLAVKDLLALGRVCLCPEDDLTLAAVLRSPFCDVTEEGLFDLAHPRAPNRPLWYELKERVARGDAEPGLARAERFLQGLIDRADYLRPFELYAHALSVDAGAGSGRARLVARLGAEAEDPIDEFLAQTLSFETRAAPTLQALIGWMSARDTEIKREHEAGEDEVRVMTAHGAKGLEAPVVVLPDTTGPPEGGRAPKLLDPVKLGGAENAPPIWVGKKDADPPAVSALRDTRAELEAEEHRRLLYVALTRAEDRLLICGAATRSAKAGKSDAPEGSWWALCHDAMARADDAERRPGPTRDADGNAELIWRLAGRGDGRVAEPAADETGPASAPPAPWIARAAPKETAPSDLAPSKLGGEDPEAEVEIETRGSGLAAGAAASRGELIHLALELLADLPPAQRDPRGRALLARQAAAFATDVREEMLREVLAVFELPEAAELFGPGSAAEVPVGAILPALGPGALYGVIDRLVVAPARILIVDFKSGRVPAEPPEAYLRQLAAYREAVRPLYPDRPIDAALLWTAAPNLQPIDPATLSAAFERASAETRRAAKSADPASQN